MTYNSLIPQPGDLISVSQNDLLNNFTSMQTTFSTDHLGFNPITNLGFHKFVTFADVAPDPAGLTFQSSRIYTKSFGTAPNRNTEMYFAQPRETSSQLISLVPNIKAMARFTTDGSAGVNVPQTILSTNTLLVNVASIVGNSPLNPGIITVTFTNPLDYDTYYVFFTPTSVQSILVDPIISQTTSGFTFRITLKTSGTTLGFMVI